MNILLIGSCGYIGSELLNRLKLDEDLVVDTCDIGWFNHIKIPMFNECYHSALYENRIKFSKYDFVVLLAGHSSVAMCENNTNCYLNNVQKFIYLYDTMMHENDKCKLIYASSGSVYGSSNLDIPFGEDLPINLNSLNYYDATKKTIDDFSEVNKFRNLYSLRFGTVNGFSDSFRPELIVNSMYGSAIKNGEINVSSPNKYRAILDISDCVEAIYQIIKQNNDCFGVYNLSSFNTQIKQIAYDIVSFVNNNINVNILPLESSNYSFTMDTRKFSSVFNFTFKGSISTICGGLKDKTPRYSIPRNLEKRND